MSASYVLFFFFLAVDLFCVIDYDNKMTLFIKNIGGQARKKEFLNIYFPKS